MIWEFLDVFILKVGIHIENFHLTKDLSNNQDRKCWMKCCLIHEMLGCVYAHIVLEIGLRDLDNSFHISYLYIENFCVIWAWTGLKKVNKVVFANLPKACLNFGARFHFRLIPRSLLINLHNYELAHKKPLNCIFKLKKEQILNNFYWPLIYLKTAWAQFTI